jgi:hypothetical protein
MGYLLWGEMGILKSFPACLNSEVDSCLAKELVKFFD